MTLTVGSLFSGIGGIDLGLERAGMEVVWQAEVDPYASKVLAKHWPDVPNLGDVTKVDWENDALDHGNGIARSLYADVVAGGFPCQPVSLAGRGLAQLDERWLWPEFARCVRSLRPRYVVVENVPGLLVRGMGDVLGDLADCGYDAEWTGIPAAAVGAPHLRWRIFVVAHAGGPRRREVAGGTSVHEGPHAGRAEEEDHQPDGDGQGGGAGDVADPEVFAERSGLCADEPGWLGWRRLGHLRGPDRIRSCPGCGEDWCEWHAVHRGDCGCADPWDDSEDPALGWWAIEPDIRRVADGVPSRVDRLCCLGNAVVPQVAEYVGRCLLAFEDQRQSLLGDAQCGSDLGAAHA